MNPLLAIAPTHAALAEVSALQGNAQLVNIAQYDSALALTVKALLDLLEKGDFANAHVAAMNVRARIWKLHCATAVEERERP